MTETLAYLAENQKISSAATSVNQLPAVLRLIDKLYGKGHHGAQFWVDVDVCLDYGGGKYDKLTDALAKRRIWNLVWDPFNRSEDHNALVLKLCAARRADFGICSNVLNVIREPKIRKDVLEDISIGVEKDGMIFITVHEGDKSSKGKKTSKGWQSNRPAKNYMREIRRVFPNSFGCRWGNKALIVCKNWPEKIPGWPNIGD